MGKSFFPREILSGEVLFFYGKFCRVDPGGCTLNLFLPAAPFFIFCSAKKGSLSDSVV